MPPSSRVAPFTGAWIEILANLRASASTPVAPFTGAWIEIVSVDIDLLAKSSLPSRERGLKLHIRREVSHERKVAPFTGAWIEI